MATIGDRKNLQRDFIFRAKMTFQPVRRDKIFGAEHIFPQVERIIEYLNNFRGYGHRKILFSGGAIFWGPAGCGKTFFSRYVATKSHARFINMRDFPVNLKNGVHIWQPADVVNLFRFSEEYIKKNGCPIILFIDQFDDWFNVHGPSIGADLETELDGMPGRRKGVFFIGTSKTNPEEFGGSIFRPGRIGIQVAFSCPDHRQQVAMLKGLLRDYPHDSKIDFENLVYLLKDPTPASLKFNVEDAAFLAASEYGSKKENRQNLVGQPHITEKHLLGVFLKKFTSSQTGHSLSSEGLLCLTVHELGHYIVGRALGLPMRFVSIVPSVESLGLTFLSDDPADNPSVNEMRFAIATTCGGPEASGVCGLEDKLVNQGDVGIVSEIAESIVANGYCRLFLKEYGLLNMSRDAGYGLVMSPEILSKLEKEMGRLIKVGQAQARQTLKFFGKELIIAIAKKIMSRPFGVVLQKELDKMLEPKLPNFHRLHKIKDRIKT